MLVDQVEVQDNVLHNAVVGIEAARAGQDAA